MEHEALFIVADDSGWKLTGAFRNGTAESILATDVGNPEEYAALPEHLRSACWPVDRPCVVVQASSLCLLSKPEQVSALAQWLMAASIALESALEDCDA
jgi:hypothetical protein